MKKFVNYTIVLLFLLFNVFTFLESYAFEESCTDPEDDKNNEKWQCVYCICFFERTEYCESYSCKGHPTHKKMGNSGECYFGDDFATCKNDQGEEENVYECSEFVENCWDK